MASRDTIVIGAGLAGLMGALALAEAGLRPLLLAKGQGTTHWTSGCIDIWGQGESPRSALEQLIATRTDHPYARVGVEGVEVAVERFLQLARAGGLPYAGSLSRNLLLPTATGALRPTYLVPATMAAGDMRQGGKLLVVGFHELRDFYPPLIAANLRAQGYDASGVYVDLPPSERRRDFSPRNTALLFDKPELRRNVAQQVRELRGDATRIAFPAVLGLDHAPEVVREIQSICGALVFEIPMLPPSVPGMRLFNLLRRAVEAADGRVQIGSEVLRAEAAEGRLHAVFSQAAAREQRHLVGQLLLATGGIAGGGLRAGRDGVVREVALNLPVEAPASRSEWFQPRFMADEGQPIYRAGIVVDAELRPLDAAGRVVYDNLRAAGVLLAGVDPVRERCYEGIALATGWQAGQMLARQTVDIRQQTVGSRR